MAQLWIIDDDPSIRWVLEKAFDRAGISHRSFASGQEALLALDHDRPQVIMTDLRMPAMSGHEFIHAIKKADPNVPVIIMTAYSDLDTAVTSFQEGAFEYLAKPFDVEEAVEVVQKALAQQDNDALEEELPLMTNLLGKSAAMQEIFRAIGRLSQSHVTVLITGESGTGKELVARALHRHSPRANKPFIAINTAAMPHDLLEAELFGHEKGAFTGAQSARQGHFERANGGTLFLDEIGDMPADLQTRLLRVLSTGEFYRVGGTTAVKVNVRIIAATHQDLLKRVEEGKFREDLYHRLNVIRLRLPPLRERKEDIDLLARYFLSRAAQELGMAPKQVLPETSRILQNYPWPGNVREIENLCQWLMVMVPGSTITPSDLPEEFQKTPSLEKGKVSTHCWLSNLAVVVQERLQKGNRGFFEEMLKDFEKTLISEALKHTGGKKIEAALLLGIGRNTLTRKMQDFGIADEVVEET
jgi:two-component system nitrogen regulation response regulator GlnG